MPKEIEKFAFTAFAAEPPDDTYHTYEEWMELIEASARTRARSPLSSPAAYWRSKGIKPKPANAVRRIIT